MSRVAVYIFTLMISSITLSSCSHEERPDPFYLMEGEAIYKVECASCHGAQLEGQAGWKTRRADGKLAAPPQDASGQSWKKSRETLAAIIHSGMVEPHAPAGYISDMPAFANKLSEHQINNVLLYIESHWTPEIISWRAQQNMQ
ncbi:MAG: cytochrome c [Gammaproteobacteria bacterium]|nr:cytochrome c [Gammaproteobacteria bacterium]